METLWRDLRYGVRSLRKTPGFTLIAVLTLALGIGANTAIFSVADAALFKTLSVKSPEQLVLFEWESGKDFRTTGIRGTFISNYYSPGKTGNSAFQPRIIEKLRQESAKTDSPLESLFIFSLLNELNVVTKDQAEMAIGQVISGNYFSSLGVPAQVGRMITDDDDHPAATPTVVISDKYWRTRFASNPSVIGERIAINKTQFTVIGIAPPTFKGTLQVGSQPDLSLPLAFAPVLESNLSTIDKVGAPAVWWLNAMGRLKPGATLEQARASLHGTFQTLALELMPPPSGENQPTQLQPADYPTLIARSGSRGMLEVRHLYSSTIWLLFGVVGLILLIACANVANMMLARAAARGGEITVRLTIGAGRWRLLRQLLTESLILSGLGGALGTLFAVWGKDILALLGDRNGSFLPMNLEYNLSWQTLGFTFFISTLTGIAFGLAPALRATKIDLATALKEKAGNARNVANSYLNKILIVLQVAISFLLLIGAGLTVRTLVNLQRTDVGFNQERLLLFSLQPGANGYKDERLIELYERIFTRLDTLPGVRSSSFASVPLIAQYLTDTKLILPGESVRSAQSSTNTQTVRENYFATMEIPLLRGRMFTNQDNQRSQLVVIISETFAHKYFPNNDPIGQRIGFDAATAGKVEIIGVARDIKYNRQREEKTPLLYIPWRQNLPETSRMFFTLRTSGDPLELVSSVRQVIRAADDSLPITEVKTQILQSSETLTEERLFAQLFSFFGLLALSLASLGLYGVMAYVVTQRTNEIGIRMALGAQRSDVLKLVIRQGLMLTLVGLGIGAIGVFILKRVIENQLYNVQASDPGTFAAAGALLFATAFFACFVPARRATKVDPMIALRQE